jgi:hypothetical protein
MFIVLLRGCLLEEEYVGSVHSCFFDPKKKRNMDEIFNALFLNLINKYVRNVNNEFHLKKLL